MAAGLEEKSGELFHCRLFSLPELSVIATEAVVNFGKEIVWLFPVGALTLTGISAESPADISARTTISLF